MSLILVALLIIGLSPLSPVGISSLQKAHATTKTISLVGYYNIGWNNTPANPTITIKQGDTLVITTSSGDTFNHHFFVDTDQDMSMIPNCSTDKCAAIIPPTHTDTLSGFSAGTFTYYCEYHSLMKGTFIVQATPDFAITPNPASLTVNQGTSQTSTLTVSSLNGFSGTVTLLPPTAPTGFTATLSTSMVSVTPSASGTTTLNVTVGASATPGSYTVSVTGSGGGNTHTANVAIIVVGPDFSISLDKSSLSIVVGASGNATVTLTSLNGFSGAVNLAATVSPTGPSVSFTPTAVSLAAGGSGTSRLTLTASSGPNPGSYYSNVNPGSYYSSVNPGSYMVTVTGTVGSSLSHSAGLSLTVSSQSSPAAPIPAYVLVIAGVAILAAVIIVAIAVLRGRSSKTGGKPAAKPTAQKTSR